mmetsp:Transcript_17321/g.25911  ORF Transcript_17321/g.25911 Transcript_17321/m.25911 type:complete len:626 (+) Transcript_17321:46-1923(+)
MMKIYGAAALYLALSTSDAFTPFSRGRTMVPRPPGGPKPLMSKSSDVTFSNPFASLLEMFQKETPKLSTLNPANSVASKGQLTVKSFIEAMNSRADPEELVNYFADDVKFVDTAYYNPIEGKAALLKHFYLNAGSSAMSSFIHESLATIAIEEIVASDNEDVSKVCIMYHLEEAGVQVPDSTAITFYTVKDDTITQVFDVTEPPSPKPGDSGLKLLKSVSKLIGNESIVVGDDDILQNGKTSVEQYFAAWNRRDMEAAVSNFSDDCQMRDSQYEGAFSGKDEFKSHLLRVKDCLPGSFNFVVDDIAVASEGVGVSWHVENSDDPLAFTRGASFYKTDSRSGLIISGFEIPEKAPPKLGAFNTIASKFQAEPIRYIPAVMWVAYMYILFFSDGILPGVNALALEQRTWEEVRDLSINFFLVSPLLNLPFSPVVHPMLEGVFNLLLAWAAMFAGFLSDERKNKPNILPFGPCLLGMQFLTSGFLLPYLFARTSERDTQVYKEDIDGGLQATVGEWRPLGAFLGTVGTGSIVWGLNARPEFGEFGERCNSFVDLLSIDRVGSSFLVDLAIFAMFQGWFIDDDLQRRGVANDDLMALRSVGKFVPFFGLGCYLTFRPSLPCREDDIIES